MVAELVEATVQIKTIMSLRQAQRPRPKKTILNQNIMKTVLKALCTAGAILLGTALPTEAQTSSGDVRGYKYEFNLMVGMTPATGYTSEEFPECHSYYGTGELSDFYRSYTDDPEYTPYLSADFNVYLSKWVKVGASAGYSRFWANKYDPRSNNRIGEKSLNDLSLLGQAKFTYINRQIFRMYSGVGAGAEVWAGDDNGDFYSKLVPAFEIIPIGFQWTDHRIYTTLEIALGTRMMGVRAGLGYRF